MHPSDGRHLPYQKVHWPLDRRHTRLDGECLSPCGLSGSSRSWSNRFQFPRPRSRPCCHHEKSNNIGCLSQRVALGSGFTGSSVATFRRARHAGHPGCFAVSRLISAERRLVLISSSDLRPKLFAFLAALGRLVRKEVKSMSHCSAKVDAGVN